MPDDIYCGVGPIKKGAHRGTMKECAEKRQIRYYGVKKVDPRLVDVATGKRSKGQERGALIKEITKLKGTVKKGKAIMDAEKDKEKKAMLRADLEPIVALLNEKIRAFNATEKAVPKTATRPEYKTAENIKDVIEQIELILPMVPSSSSIERIKSDLKEVERMAREIERELLPKELVLPTVPKTKTRQELEEDIDRVLGQRKEISDELVQGQIVKLLTYIKKQFQTKYPKKDPKVTANSKSKAWFKALVISSIRQNPAVYNKLIDVGNLSSNLLNLLQLITVSADPALARRATRYGDYLKPLFGRLTVKSLASASDIKKLEKEHRENQREKEREREE